MIQRISGLPSAGVNNAIGSVLSLTSPEKNMRIVQKRTADR